MAHATPESASPPPKTGSPLSMDSIGPVPGTQVVLGVASKVMANPLFVV